MKETKGKINVNIPKPTYFEAILENGEKQVFEFYPNYIDNPPNGMSYRWLWNFRTNGTKYNLPSKPFEVITRTVKELYEVDRWYHIDINMPPPETFTNACEYIADVFNRSETLQKIYIAKVSNTIDTHCVTDDLKTRWQLAKDILETLFKGIGEGKENGKENE